MARHHLVVLLCAAALIFTGCATKGLDEKDLGDPAKSSLGPDEAFVITQAKVVGMGWGHLALITKSAGSPDSRQLLRAINGQEQPVVLKVKAGLVTASHLSMGAPFSVSGTLKEPMSSQVRAGMINYIGDITMGPAVGPGGSLGIRVTRNPNTVREVKDRFPDLFRKYPLNAQDAMLN